VTDIGEEYRFTMPRMVILGMLKNGPDSPTLLSAEDPKALAAAQRTKVLRVVEHLRKALQQRPTRNMTTEDIRLTVERIRNHATVAFDDLKALS
jgi:hypothetical protein